ncbi:MAG TPA: hypothetical protein VGI40_21825 [Pirellulaceae bacterium]
MSNQVQLFRSQVWAAGSKSHVSRSPIWAIASIRSFFVVAIYWALAGCAQGEIKPAAYDLSAVRDPATLETRIVQDWKPVANDPSIRQKLVEVTVCEWWPGQKVRLPVTFVAPASGGPCRDVIVANMGLALRPALPSGAALRLLKEKRVGVVLVGMGTIDAMRPAGKLRLGMQEQLLKTKDTRFTPAWIWGLSDMRALTAAIAENDAFQPTKVLATGGSKRGVAAAVAGIHDDRFTAIMPIVAPPLGNPGGAYVVGTDPAEITKANEVFLAALADGKMPGLPATAHAALVDRQDRRIDERITLAQAQTAGWSEAEIAQINDRAWDICHAANYLQICQRRGLEIFYNVGTNDNVSPSLRELGHLWPQFPIYIVPGGQHGGPKGAGFSRQVPTLPEVDENLFAFAEHHFFGTQPNTTIPKINATWDSPSRTLHVDVTFANEVDPQKNELSWSLNRHPPYTLAFEYDRWNAIQLKQIGHGRFSSQIVFQAGDESIQLVTTHTYTIENRSLSFSSPLLQVDLR